MTNEINKDELMNKLTLGLVLSITAPTKETAQEATKLAEQVIEMGLTHEDVEECKKRAIARVDGGGNPLEGLDGTTH